jgi:hypothetical protein
MSMSWLTIPAVLQLVVGLGLLNVWLVRTNAATEYRGGQATSLREEFAVYGLPSIAFPVVGVLKVGSAVVLIAGVWVSSLPVTAAAGVIAALMIGALAMHVKVGDPAKRSVPAAIMLVMSAAIVLLTV